MVMRYWPVAMNHRAPRAEREGGNKAGEEETRMCAEQETQEGGGIIMEVKRALESAVTYQK
jgi:hypothetical protein